MKLGGLRVAVWFDPDSADDAQPVIVFSHGLYGCATQSRFLMEAFAKAGYIVFAPNHRDSTCNGGSWLKHFRIPHREPSEWTDGDFRDRAEDIGRLLDAIRADDRFRESADLSRLGLVGHSLGGYTVLGLGGAWASWTLPGVRAVLALSPYVQPFIAHNTLGGLAAPVMYQGGTFDLGITPHLEKVGGAYDQSPSPKYLVAFDHASHFAWTNVGFVAHERIVAYGVAFMDTYVKGLPRESEMTRSERGVSVLRYSEAAGKQSIP